MVDFLGRSSPLSRRDFSRHDPDLLLAIVLFRAALFRAVVEGWKEFPCARS